jgi:imidazolonepropionase-like amidohydrolase
MNMQLRFSFILILIVNFFPGCSTRVVDGDIALVHVNVIPMDKEHILIDQTVVLKDELIIYVGPSSSIKISSETHQIDAARRYLIPALSDMHVHIEGDAWTMLSPLEPDKLKKPLDFEMVLFPFIANGVATIQVMSALPEHPAICDKIDNNELLAPRMILGKMIDSPAQTWPPPINTFVSTAEQARQAVIDAKDGGYHSIKVYTFLSSECYDAVIKTADEIGISVIGHIPDAVTVEHVIESGQKLIAHSEEVMKQAKGDYSQAKIDHYVGLIADSNTWITPTLVTSRNIISTFDNLDEKMKQPEIQYLHPMTKGAWTFINNMYTSIPKNNRHYIRDGFKMFQLPFTKALYDAGVKLLAGTDSFLPTIVPGYSLHDELKEFVDIGMTPYEALKTSTTHPFEYLGEIENAGTIEKNKIANLVLLEKNPLEDISNTKSIAGVIIKGHYISAEEIEVKLNDLADSYMPN